MDRTVTSLHLQHRHGKGSEVHTKDMDARQRPS